MPLPRDPSDLLCFSQLRWDFVYQRPHHLMTRAARDRRVWFVEEPVFEPDGPRLVVEERAPGVSMVRPVVPPGWPEADVDAAVSLLLHEFVTNRPIERPIAWYHTPLALAWTSWLEPAATVYDCMDELSAFRFASPRIGNLEAQLLRQADVVFTGGQSLYEAKRNRHANVHAFPSAVDAAHFGASPGVDEPPGQRELPRPRVGWFGVIDERMDLDLIAGIADLRPDWSFILIGPTVKIDPASIPVRPNLHLLGPRPYAELPAFLAGWDVAMMPFARNESTRYISPTKTLEYLAAGKPVVSTSIRDVVEPYERLGVVRIADAPDRFVAAIEAAMADRGPTFQAAARRIVAGRSWDDTWRRMSSLINDALQRHSAERVPTASSTAADAAGRTSRTSRRTVQTPPRRR